RGSPSAAPVPYTTLFRSRDQSAGGAHCEVRIAPAVGDLDGGGVQLPADQHHGGGSGRGGDRIDRLGPGRRCPLAQGQLTDRPGGDRKSTRLNSSHVSILY